MIQAFSSYLQDKCLINSVQFVLLGVSGGADSMCLLDIFLKISHKVAVGHFNHQLREDAAGDAVFVQNYASTRGVACYVGKGNVAEYASTHRLSEEEAGRQLRYAFLFDTAVRIGADAVAVAHNADDQVETVLMHLLRGAGLDGLSGMRPRTIFPAWSPSIPLARPLLGTRRAEIEAYCAENRIPYRTDPTNTHLDYFRNRLRHTIIPLLMRESPALHTRVEYMTDTLAADRDVLDTYTDDTMKSICVEIRPGVMCLERDAFSALPLGMQRRVVRRVVAQVQPDARDAGFDVVARAVDGIAQGMTQFDLIGGVRGVSVGEVAYIHRQDIPIWTSEEFPQLPDDTARHLSIPGEVELASGWRITAEVLPRASLPAPSADVACLDADGVGDSVWVRGRVSGERFSPLGMGTHAVKLSDLMINEKLPEPLRKGWPLIVVGEQVVWVPRLGRSGEFVISEATSQGVVFRLVPPTPRRSD